MPKILLGTQCVVCEKEAGDHCPKCGEWVHMWRYSKTTYRPEGFPQWFPQWYPLRISRPASCYDQHREECDA